MRRDSVKMMAFCAAPSSAALAKAMSSAFSSALPLALCSMEVASWAKPSRSAISCSMAARSASESGCGGLVVGPFLGGFVERFVVLVQLLFERFGRFLLAQLGLQPVRDGRQRAGDGEGGRGQQLAQHQRHQRALAGGQRLQVVALQVVGDQVVEPVFAFFRRELLHQRQALGVGDVGSDLPAQRAVADGLQPRLQRLEDLLLVQIGELLAEALQVAEGVLVDEADQAEELQQRVLQRRRGEQQLVALPASASLSVLAMTLDGL